VMDCVVANHYTAKASFVFRFSIWGLGLNTLVDNN
jgi:hypothetical protein